MAFHLGTIFINTESTSTGYAPKKQYQNRQASQQQSQNTNADYNPKNQQSQGQKENMVGNVVVSSSPAVHNHFHQVSNALAQLSEQQLQHLAQQLTAKMPSINEIPGETYGSTSAGNIICTLTEPSLNFAEWIIDSGATTHIFCNLELFDDITSISETTVTLSNKTQIAINQFGTVKLSDKLLLKNVLFIPSFHLNLLSVSSILQDYADSVNFFPSLCTIQEFTPGFMIGRGSLRIKLYWLDLLFSQSVRSSSSSQILNNTSLSHSRLGHPSFSKIQVLSEVISIPKAHLKDWSHCKTCHLAKQKRLAFPSHNNLAEKPFDLIHLDVWGPFSVTSVEGFKYFLTIVDDCSRVTWIYFLKHKSDVIHIFPNFLNLVETYY